MIDDPIVAEVRKAREEILAEVGYDLNRLMERLRQAQEAHPERLARLPPQTPVLRVFSGVVRGNTVVLDQEPGLADGQRVQVVFRAEEEDQPAGGVEQQHQVAEAT